MDDDLTQDAVMCFQHCQKDVDILCFQMPENCPICNANMETTPVMEMPPFRLPSPFTNGASSPFSLLMRPTNGSFLLDYTNSSDLHVGITDSRGTVYDFDSDGLHASTARWNLCIAILLESRGAEAALEWDTKLQEFAMKPEWQASQYNEQTRNCYHFVINFLQYYGLTLFPADSEEFCEEVILPRTIQAAKYIGLYRQLKKDQLLINYRDTYESEQGATPNHKTDGENSPSTSVQEQKQPTTKPSTDYEMAETKL